MDKKFNLIFIALVILLGVFVSQEINLVSAEATGCCEVDLNGVQCSTTTETNCAQDSNFAENTQCEATSFCQSGCCYDDDSGIYDKNVLQSSCTLDWDPDPSCNLPGADNGCCVLGSSTIYETQGQCAVDTTQRGYEEIDWRTDLDEQQCVTLSQSQDEGACVLSEGNCKLTTGQDCIDIGGQFSVGNLCTATSLNTLCEKTTQTKCIDGEYGVYFVDSCGNKANIYDSNKAEIQSYWEKIIEPENSCGASATDGNSNSKDCGNCNIFQGGLCSSAAADNFNPDSGDFYCKEVSCTFKGQKYENGESWCEYDGAIGDSNDVPGSRHWKYVCNQGNVDIDPCRDAREEICVQSNTELNGSAVFRNAECLTNNWNSCLEINTKTKDPKKLVELCEEEINCRVDEVYLGDPSNSFRFRTCVPQYPAGYDFKEPEEQKKSANLCKQASRTCKVVRKKNIFGKCKVKDNDECLNGVFAKEMNELCRSLGDCGGEVNLNGDFVSNYLVKNSPKLSQNWISQLKDLSNPVNGQSAVLADYSDYLELIGITKWDFRYSATTAGYTNKLFSKNIDKEYGRKWYGNDNSKGFWDKIWGSCSSRYVEYTCNAWQPPKGGDACEVCNGDPLKPCSKYRCESFGATCELANIGTGNELCYDAGTDDVNPPILSPQIGYISATEKYSDITNKGFSITDSNGGCLDAYTPILFGVTTDEVSNCRYDTEMKDFEDMYYDMSDGLSLYNHSPHSIPFYLPDPSHGESQGLNWTGELDLYVKCQDGNGNENTNPDFYNIKMCVKQGPDETPPLITATSPESGSLISFDSTSEDIQIVTNEFSTCRWADTDMDYSVMPNQMTCDDEFAAPSDPFGYVCTTTLPITNPSTTKYVRCSDQPWFEGTSNESLRNPMTEGFSISLNKPDKKIEIDEILPSEDFEVPTDVASTNLQVTTSNGGNNHICSYSFSDQYTNLVQFFETGGNTHNQVLNLQADTHEIFVECTDETGDTARGSTEFEIIKDTNVPQVARIWQDSGDIIFLTSEPADCRYSETTCNFKWENATKAGTDERHVINAVQGRAYHIKCRDEFGNGPSSCSARIIAS